MNTSTYLIQSSDISVGGFVSFNQGKYYVAYLMCLDAREVKMNKKSAGLTEEKNQTSK